LRYAARIYGDSFRFATREVVEEYCREASRFVHPWFEEQIGVDLSSIALIQALIAVTSTPYHFPFALSDQPAYIHPLLSQPLIEVALRIPGHFSVRQGWNRAAARAGFFDLLSDEVRFRTGKTDMTPWVRQAVRQNTAWLREFLLDGILARQNIIDKNRVESVLSDTANNNTTLINHLFIPLYIEGWLRQWRL
jgi:asparagine synthase (glutamine-hydrolysing)